MPHIVVFNLSKIDYTKERTALIEEAITSTLCAISKIRLTGDKITYSFPQDPTIESDEVAVKIIIEEFYDSPEINSELRNFTAKVVAETFKSVVTGWRRLKSVSVSIPRFDPVRDGHATVR